nr:hypothetical protein [Thermococcus chitonophagus]
MIFVLMLVYSLKLTAFTSQSSQDILATQIGIEAKGLASMISNGISQVYAQGPGAKVTVYYRAAYLRDVQYVARAFNLDDPIIAISYSNGTYVMLLNGTGASFINFSGPYKNIFWANSIYRKDFLTNTTVFLGSSVPNVNFNGTIINLACLKISPSSLPKILKIVVEWDPNTGDVWIYNATSGEILIKINPGG